MKINTLMTTAALVLVATFGTVQAATVYIPEGSANDVLVVDGQTGQTIKHLPNLESVHGLSGAPGVKYLVAGSFTEIARSAAQAIPKPDTVSSDEHAAHHRKPVANAMPAGAGISILSILDVKTGEPVRRIEVPGAVHHTAVSPDGRFAVATQPAANGISIINLEDLTFVAFLPTGAMPNYAVFSNDSKRVYVTNTGNGTISEVDVAKGFVIRNFLAGKGPEHIARSADGKTLYVADAEAGNVLELSSSTGEITRSFAIGGELHGIGLSDDSKVLFVSDKGEDKLASVDLGSGKLRTVTLGPSPYHLAVIPGTGTMFVSSSAEPVIWIVDIRSLTVRTKINVEGEGHQMVVLP